MDITEGCKNDSTWYMKNLLQASVPKAFHAALFSILSTSSVAPSSIALAERGITSSPAALSLRLSISPDFIPPLFLAVVSNAKLLVSSTPSTRAIVSPVAVLVSLPRMCQQTGGFGWDIVSESSSSPDREVCCCRGPLNSLSPPPRPSALSPRAVSNSLGCHATRKDIPVAGI